MNYPKLANFYINSRYRVRNLWRLSLRQTKLLPRTYKKIKIKISVVSMAPHEYDNLFMIFAIGAVKTFSLKPSHATFDRKLRNLLARPSILVILCIPRWLV